MHPLCCASWHAAKTPRGGTARKLLRPHLAAARICARHNLCVAHALASLAAQNLGKKKIEKQNGSK